MRRRRTDGSPTSPRASEDLLEVRRRFVPDEQFPKPETLAPTGNRQAHPCQIGAAPGGGGRSGSLLRKCTLFDGCWMQIRQCFYCASHAALQVHTISRIFSAAQCAIRAVPVQRRLRWKDLPSKLH